MKKSKAPQAMLPLDESRSVALRGPNKHLFTWHFRRIAQQDWEEFFAGIVHRTLRHEGAQEQVFDSDTALIELVDTAVTSVVGYDGVDAENWKARLPIKHKFAVGVVLRSVGRERDADDGALSEFVEVPLSASWSMEAQSGKMTMYSGLIHRFRHPSIEQLRKFNFEAARTRILGSGDDGITVYPVRQSIAMKLYDELIDSVDGYSVGGEPLTGVEAIRREMDGHHKATAALEMFAAGSSIEIL
jgi:hypothetical protein